MKLAPRLCLLLGWAQLSACVTTVPVADVIKQARRPSSATVAILQTQENELSEAVLGRFLEAMDAKVVLYSNVDKADASDLVRTIHNQKAQAVFALGPAAAIFARDNLADIPSLFTLVINYRTQHLHEVAHMMGIAMEGSSASEFTKFKMVYPQLHRVLMPYTTGQSEALVEAAVADLKKMSIELVPVAVSPSDKLTHLEGLTRNNVDAVWIASDALILSKAKALIAAADAQGVPLINSVTGALARTGAFASVAVDIPSIGTQAATMINSILQRGGKPEQFKVQAPMGTRLVVNMDVAKQRGIEVPPFVLQFIGELAGNDSR